MGYNLSQLRVMYAKTTKQRASRGSVQIRNSHGRLQLNFSAAGKRHYLSLGLDDTPLNRKAAEAKAKQIELDILSDNFDVTLDKYRPKSTLTTLIPKAEPRLGELWDRYMAYKTPQLSPNTLSIMYGCYTNYLKRLPSQNLSDAPLIRDWCLQNLPLNSCKRFITRLSSCCEWSMQSGYIKSNPFQGMSSQIKIPKSQNKDEVQPFTQEERDRILTALKENTFCSPHSNTMHSFYYPFVRFLFSTGCRPSEAIALEWRHISSDYRWISFEQALVETRHTRILRQGLKTQDKRRFPCNESMRTFLAELEAQRNPSTELVFPGPKGKYLDSDSLNKGAWRQVLRGLGLDVRKLYQTRHTFITLALENGLDAKDVAKLVGNSAEVIYRHYAGNKRDLFVPEF